jgi:predicted nucleic acid-binding Zn ribbon protein
MSSPTPTPLPDDRSQTLHRLSRASLVDCPTCGKALTGRQRFACSPKCLTAWHRRERERKARLLLTTAQESIAEAQALLTRDRKPAL